MNGSTLVYAHNVLIFNYTLFSFLMFSLKYRCFFSYQGTIFFTKVIYYHFVHVERSSLKIYKENDKEHQERERNSRRRRTTQ